MAKQRVRVTPLEGVPTTITPTARPVDIYTRPEARQDVNADLRAFVEGVTPALREISQREKQMQQEESRAIVQGVHKQEAYLAKSRTRKLLANAGQAFQDNYQKYLEEGEQSLINDRQAYFTKEITELEKAGMNPAMLTAMKQDLEMGDFAFYEQTYKPLAAEHKVNQALDMLSSNLYDINDAPVPDGEKVKMIESELKSFKDAYSFVPMTAINETAEDIAENLSMRVDGEGLVTGTNVFSSWMVSKNRHTTGRGSKIYTKVLYDDNRRQEQIASLASDQAAVTKSRTAFVDGTLVAPLNNLNAMLEANVDKYIDDRDALQQVVQDAKEDYLSQFEEGTDDYNLASARWDNEWAIKSSQGINPKLMQGSVDRNTGLVVEAVLGFQSRFASTSGRPMDAGFVQDVKGEFKDYIETLYGEANVTSDVEKEKIAGRILTSIKNTVETEGVPIGILEYFSTEGLLSKEANRKLLNEIKVANQNRNNFLTSEAGLIESIRTFVETGSNNLNVLPREYQTKAGGKPVAWTQADQDRAFEKAYPNMSEQEKITSWYLPNNRVKQEHRNIINSGVGMFSFGDLGTMDTPSENVAMAENTYNLVTGLVTQGYKLETLLPNEENRKRYNLLKYSTQEGQRTFNEAIRIVQAVSSDTLNVKRIGNLDDAMNVLDKFSPLSTDFSETDDATGNALIIQEQAALLAQVDPGKSEQEYIQAAGKMFEEDHVIITDSDGRKSTIKKLSGDTSKTNVVSKLDQLAISFAEHPDMKAYATEIFGRTSDFGIRFRDNPQTEGMMDILIYEAEGALPQVVGTYTAESLLQDGVVKEVVSNLVFSQETVDTLASLEEAYENYVPADFTDSINADLSREMMKEPISPSASITNFNEGRFGVVDLRNMLASIPQEELEAVGVDKGIFDTLLAGIDNDPLSVTNIDPVVEAGDTDEEAALEAEAEGVVEAGDTDEGAALEQFAEVIDSFSDEFLSFDTDRETLMTYFENLGEDFKTTFDNIDYDFIGDLEGSLKTKGYIPEDKQGNILDKSGVTVSTGVDLGSKSRNYFEGLDKALVDKVAPYFGLKGEKAKQKLAQVSLNITKDEARTLYKFTRDKELKLLKARWSKEVEAGNTDVAFEDLPKKLQTVLASVSFQYGSNLPKETPNFWKHSLKVDLPKVLAELRNFGDKYPTRRNKEADYLESNKET